MSQVRNQLMPLKTSQDQDHIISQALHCLESRLQQSSDRLNSSQDVSKYLRLQLGDEKDEVFGVLFLDNDFHLLAFEKLFFGTINEAHVYPRKIVRKALELNAAKIVLAHNHPSGAPRKRIGIMQLRNCLAKEFANG